jgi:hypothetical protein
MRSLPPGVSVSKYFHDGEDYFQNALDKKAQETLKTDPAFASIDNNAKVVTFEQLESRTPAVMEDCDPEASSKFHIRCLLEPAETSTAKLSLEQEAKLAALGVTGSPKPISAEIDKYNQICPDQEARLKALGVTGHAKPPLCARPPIMHNEIPPWRLTRNVQTPVAVNQSSADPHRRNLSNNRTTSAPFGPCTSFQRDSSSTSVQDYRKRGHAVDFNEGDVRDSQRSKISRMR